MMKLSNIRSMTLLALAAGTALITTAASAVTSANGDLFLGFRATGGTGATKNYVVNLGQASQFEGRTTPLTLTTSAVGTDLTNLFSDTLNNIPWFSRNDLFWGVGGTTGSFAAVGSDAAKTLFGTRRQLTPGTQSTPWLRKSDSTQGSITSKMLGLYGVSGSFETGTPRTATNSVSQNTGDANSWSSYQPGGTTANSGASPGISFAHFNPTIEGSFENGTAGSFLDLYRLAPAANIGEVDTNGEYLGRLVFNDSGVLTFIPVAAFGVSSMEFSSATGSVSETGGTVAVTVRRSGDVSSAASVQLSTANVTALAGTDYTAITNQVVNFGINETSKTVNVTVANLSGFQGDRTFTVSLSTPTGGSIGTTGTQTVTIQEAIEPSTLQFSAATFAANQNDTTVNVTVSRTGGGAAVTVLLSTSNGSAVSGTDYTAITNQTVNIPVNVNSVDVPVTLSAPSADQPNKQFTVTLSSPGANASLGTQTTSTVRILANDIIAPVVTLTKIGGLTTVNPTINGSLGGSVLIEGGATDAKGVEKVQVSMNGGAFADATVTPVTGGASWAITINPPGGPTTLVVRAIDGRNNISGLVTKTFTFVVKGSLTVNVVGSGTVTGKLVGATAYEIGKTYTLTAAPSSTSVAFDNWAGAGLSGPATEVTKLTFVYSAALAANPVITATFVSNPYAAANNVAGGYNGLVKAHTGTTASNSTNGCITVTVTVGTGAFTGSVKIDGVTLSTPISGVFDNAGVARFGTTRATTVSVPRTNKAPYVLAMNLNTGTRRITGTMKEFLRSAVAAQSDFTADRAAYSATVPVAATDLLNKAGASGYYTAVLPARAAGTVSLPGLTLANSEFPQGDGFTTITLTKAGDVTFSGTLGDGTAFTSSGKLTAGNSTVLFAQLYANKAGSIGGDVTFTVTSGDGFVAGSNLFWFRPYQAVQWYPYGWPEGLLTDLAGSEYNVIPGTSVFPGLTGVSSPNTNVMFSDGLLTSSQSKDFQISTTNVVTLTGTSLGVVIAPATGLIGGAASTFFTHTDTTKTPFKAVIVQKGASAGGWGHFLTTSPKVINGLGESGGVSLMHK